MAQVFSKRAELIVKLMVLGLAVLLVATVAWAMPQDRAYLALGEPDQQPIPFSHKHHVGDDGIDCRYCHTTVETSAFAGLPSTQICLSCHSQLYVDAPALAPLHESAASGRPIVWRRVHLLPDFVYFNHSVHVTKGVGCVECHGHIDQMPLTWRVRPLQMQWCLGCHRDPSAHLRPASQVFAMTETDALAPRDRAPLPQIEGKRRRTDCSTCHR